MSDAAARFAARYPVVRHVIIVSGNAQPHRSLQEAQRFGHSLPDEPPTIRRAGD
jgi:hypothetical protein